MLFNDNADKAAGRARDRHPIPAGSIAKVQQVDELARQTQRAAVVAVDEAAAARPAAVVPPPRFRRGGPACSGLRLR